MVWCRLRGNKHFKTESCGAVSLDLREQKRGYGRKKPLDVKSSARRVVPAYKDPDVLEDSSTTHRESINIFNGFQCQQRTRALGSHDSGYASNFLQEWVQYRERLVLLAIEERTEPRRSLNRKRVVDFERRVRFERCSSSVVDEGFACAC